MIFSPTATLRGLVPVKAKTRLSVLLGSPFVGRALLAAFPRGIPAHGARYELNGAAVPASVPAQVFWGFYENTEIRMIKRHLRRDLDVVELGSSLGVTSVAIARRLGSGRQLVCVEANPNVVPVLRANLERNEVSKVSIVQEAVAYGAPEVMLKLGVGTTDSRLAATSPSMGVMVPATTLGEIVRRFGLQRFALVCDIEGAEAQILEHDGEALSRCKQIIIELHDGMSAEGTLVTVDDLRALLSEAGFERGEQHGPVGVFARPRED